MRVTVGDSGLCCCTCVTYFERKLTPLCVDFARPLWASFCFRSVRIHPEANLCMCLFVCLYVEPVWRSEDYVRSRKNNLVLSYVCAHLCRRVCLKCRVYNYATWGHQSSGGVWKSRWPSWAFRPNDRPYGFCGRKATLNHASALVTFCP